MKIIAANHKVNHSPKSILPYLATLDSTLSKDHTTHEIIIFPNQASLVDNVYSTFDIGAQNAYPIDKGAFTGEIGLEVLESLQIGHIMLGHSERRITLGESNAFIAKKFDFFAKANMRIVLCIGEDSPIKDAVAHLGAMLDSINLDYPLLSVAYEPVWAIGSGKTPSLEDISRIVDILRSFGVKRMLYGGSVSIDNVADICAITDGVLVGSASLNVSSFINLIKRVA